MGDHVIFREISPDRIQRPDRMNVLIQSAGFLSSVQDLGRNGSRKFGVPVGGASDWHALRVANALVNNEDSAAGIEVTLGRLRLRFEDERLVAWCGGPFDVRIGNEVLPSGHVGLISKDEELTIITPKSGSRAWLAISDGIDVPLVLGSRSTDLRGNFGGHQGPSTARRRPASAGQVDRVAGTSCSGGSRVEKSRLGLLPVFGPPSRRRIAFSELSGDKIGPALPPKLKRPSFRLLLQRCQIRIEWVPGWKGQI